MKRPLIEWQGLSFRYPNRQPMVLQDLQLSIGRGEFVLVAGPSGSGKSTLLRTLNGLVPHFSGGRIAGHVRVDGRSPITDGPHIMSGLVGLVQQDPEAQFVVETVEDELAFAMENHGLPQSLMLERVEQVLRRLSMAHLRLRRIQSLSAGEKQRVAIGSVLTLQPDVLILDEPTSQLDPEAAEQTLIALRRLNTDFGLTIILSEHRLERVVQFTHRMIYLPAPGERPVSGAPEDVLLRMPFGPPVVQLAKALGWRPLPLTVQQARPFAHRSHFKSARRLAPKAMGPTLIRAHDLWCDYGGVPALCGVSLEVRQGELVALLGRNGAGKTTLLKHIVGLLQPSQGQLLVMDWDTRHVDLESVIQHVGYVPQDPSSLLFADTVQQELEYTRRAHRLAPADYDQWLATLNLVGLGERYPRDLSVGERQRVALGAILVAEPSILLLDEPTRGLDPLEKQALARFLQGQVAHGHTVIMATHDVELAAAAAQRAIILERGRVLSDGPVQEVLGQSPVFAPQVAQVFQNPLLLTVQDVLGEEPDAP